MQLVTGGGLDVLHNGHRLFFSRLLEKAQSLYPIDSILFTLKTDKFLHESRNSSRPYFSYEWRKQDVKDFLTQFNLPFDFAPIDCYQDDIDILKSDSVAGTRDSFTTLHELGYPVISLPEIGGHHSSDIHSELMVAQAQSPCHYVNVGAVLLRQGDIIASGFNNNDCDSCPKTIEWKASGKRNYNEVTYTHACTAIHAEDMALEKALPGDDLIITHSPCMKCAKLIVNKKIRRVVYLREYVSTEGLEYLQNSNVQVRKAGI